MGSCNVAQNEIGGKELLIMKCTEFTYDATDTSATITTATAHGAVVGDVVKFQSVGTATTINTTDLYSVVSVPSTTTMTVAASPGGTAIVIDDTLNDLKLDLFRQVGGNRSKSWSFSSEGIDITNQDSDQWSKILDGAGIRSVSFSADGVYTNQAVFTALRNEAMQNLLMCLMIIDVKTEEAIYGCFKVSSVEISGDYDGEGSYSISAESSGEVSIYAFP